jgi:hypothetical protein
MSRSLLPIAACLVCLLAAAFTPPAAAQFNDLVRRVPDRPNTVMMLDVARAYSSPMSEKEQWRGKMLKAFESGMIMVPPNASRFVLASQLDLDAMQPIWEVALLNVDEEISIPELAQKRGGNVDVVAGESAAALPDVTYVVKFGPTVVGGMKPANRQSVGRWIETSRDANRRPLPPYLEEAIGYVQDIGTPIIIAMDLENALAPAMIRGRLDEMKCLEGKSVDLDKLSQALASVRGVTLGITLVEKRYGGIKIDFSEDVSMTADFAKPLLLEVLAYRGAMIDEFKDWTVNVTSKQISLKGVLEPSGMRRILSLLEPPHSPDYKPAKPSSGTQPEELTVALASQEYFKTVETMLDDLRGKRKSDEFVTWGQVGIWFERYARKIDNLPILNVDNELLDYGVFVADSLRQSETAMKGIGAKSGMRKTQLSNVTGSSYYGGYGYGYGYGGPAARAGAVGATVNAAHANLAYRGQQEAQIRTQERISGNANAHFIMQGLEQATSAVRRTMTQRYKIEF